MEQILLITIMLLSIVSTSALGDMSTTKDGAFQAAAQTPCSIRLYWKHNSKPAQIYQGDTPIGIMQPDESKSFACATVTALLPNTLYTFSMGKNGPRVSEKTWSNISPKEHFDLLIIGATSSGVSAAVTAARLGLKVALVEESNRLGGMPSNGLSSTDIRQISRSNGFFEDFRRRVVQFYGQGNGLRYEPRVANAIMKSMVYEHDNILLFLKAKAIAPIIQGNAVRGAIVQDIVSKFTGNICANITIDATDTADFATAAGAQFIAGREQRSDTEPHAGVIYFDDQTQEILQGSTGEGDCRQQSYAYLMIWKDYGEGKAPLIPKPRFYDPDNYRYSPKWEDSWAYTSGRLPNDKYEINQHPFGIDWPEINYDYPAASEQRRAEIKEMYRDRALGYLYFMQNERGHTNLGLADDEFLDNNNFPQQLYIREAKRVVGGHIFNEADVALARSYYRINSIAIGDYPMDSHAVEDIKNPNRRDKGEGEFWLVSFTPWYQVPYGVLVPKGVENLIISQAVSATHVGYGTLRMEPVRMSLGQAAAAAAYWSILYWTNPRNIRPAWIQDKILSQYAYITWNPDVNRETRHFKAINFLGARGVFPDEEFRPDDPLTEEEALQAINKMLEMECYMGRISITPPPSIDASISRGRFAQWLVKAKQLVDADWRRTPPAQPSYIDVPASSPYYDAVETLLAHRISAELFENYQEGMFQPDTTISRADAAEAIFLAHRDYAMNFWRP